MATLKTSRGGGEAGGDGGGGEVGGGKSDTCTMNVRGSDEEGSRGLQVVIGR